MTKCRPAESSGSRRCAHGAHLTFVWCDETPPRCHSNLLHDRCWNLQQGVVTCLRIERPVRLVDRMPLDGYLVLACGLGQDLPEHLRVSVCASLGIDLTAEHFQVGARGVVLVYQANGRPYQQLVVAIAWGLEHIEISVSPLNSRLHYTNPQSLASQLSQDLDRLVVGGGSSGRL